MFLIATTKATTTAVVVKEEAGGSTAHTRDNNETKNEENDLLIFEAHEDALNSFEYGGSMSRKMAFMDILPVLRTMLRSEAARKDTILEVKRSNRAGRFLHYLDSIGLHLDEATHIVLQRPFSIWWDQRGIKTNTIISMVLGYDDGRYIFASAICIFVHNNKTNVIVLHIYIFYYYLVYNAIIHK